mgnify:CR=1 FL=1
MSNTRRTEPQSHLVVTLQVALLIGSRCHRAGDVVQLEAERARRLIARGHAREGGNLDRGPDDDPPAAAAAGGGTSGDGDGSGGSTAATAQDSGAGSGNGDGPAIPTSWDDIGVSEHQQRILATGDPPITSAAELAAAIDAGRDITKIKGIGKHAAATLTAQLADWREMVA